MLSCLGLTPDLNNVICDFEQYVLSAVSTVRPRALVHGCSTYVKVHGEKCRNSPRNTIQRTQRHSAFLWNAGWSGVFTRRRRSGMHELSEEQLTWTWQSQSEASRSCAIFWRKLRINWAGGGRVILCFTEIRRYFQQTSGTSMKPCYRPVFIPTKHAKVWTTASDTSLRKRIHPCREPFSRFVRSQSATSEKRTSRNS